MGTLDPMGCGLLPVLCGKATRLFDMSTNKTKIYRAVFKFGVSTDTFDSEGKIVATNDKVVSVEEIKKVLNEFVGEFDQMPPQYSSKKINGKKAYEIARAGGVVKLSPRHITISRFELVAQLEKNIFLFEIECSEGTYIRALCRDLARKLSTYGTMCAISRTKCCGKDLKDALVLSEINADTKLIAAQDFIDLPSVFVSEKFMLNLKNGIKVLASENVEGNFKLFCGDEFWGVAKIENGYYKIVRNFFGG